MAVILAYTSPALGHLFPFCALLAELAARGHDVHVRTIAAGVGLCRSLGLTAEAVDPRIEALQSAEDGGAGVLGAVGDTVRVLCARATLEVADLRGALRDVNPDVVLVDANCWGAMSAAESQATPWVVFSPFIPYLRSKGSPPFGAGAAPWPGPIGRVRDWGIGLVSTAVFDRPFHTGIRSVRAELGLPPVRDADALLRRAPRVLVATAKPFEYLHTDWGDTVDLIGPAAFDPADAPRPAWLDDIDDPIVLVTTSSVPQADERLVGAAVQALAGEPVHVVATMPSGDGAVVEHRRGATRAAFVAHSHLLDRAVCVVTHGGMGVTQKALERGIPVCAVPFGRDQFEVARRVEVARCGTRLPSRDLTPARLRVAVQEAMTRTDGATSVARGFAAAGGVHRGAQIVERQLACTPHPVTWDGTGRFRS